jgi:hypothetical protein
MPAAQRSSEESAAATVTKTPGDGEKPARPAPKTKAPRLSQAAETVIKAKTADELLGVRRAFHAGAGVATPAGARGKVVDLPPKKEDIPVIMDDAAIDLNAAADERGVSREDVLTLIERIAAETARETTARTKEEPRPDWIEARKQGKAVPDFIERAFAPELADDAMHKGLFDRYKNLRRDFHAYQRHHVLPEWLKAIPTQKEWTDRHPPVAVKPTRPVRPGVPSDEVRRFNREAKRYSRARVRQQQAVLD